MPLSQNGYPVLDEPDTRLWIVPGADRHLRLAPGAAGFVLIHFASYYHDHIERLDTGVWDEWGYAVRDIRGSSTSISNHASGTAMDLNATQHPLGTSETASMTRADIQAVNARLAWMDDVIRWGGDYAGRQDVMHYEINKPNPRVQALAERLRDTDRGQRIRSANGISGRD